MASNRFNKGINAIKDLDRRIEHLIEIGEMPASKSYYKFDYFKCLLMYSAAPTDYIFFRMYKKNRVERKNLITYRKHDKLDKTMNNYNADISIIGNKAKFNAYMKDYIKRDWIYSEDSSLDEQLNFFEKHQTVFFKPVNLTKGAGIKRLKWERKEDVEYLKSQPDCLYMLEEEIRQNECLSKLNPYAVNSMRVTTVCNKDASKSEVLSASLKLSVGENCVDNLSDGGLVFPVDLETGVISRPGLSYADDDWHIIHPVSKQVVVGTQIPNFQDIKQSVEDMAKLFPDFRYLGWDIAVTEDGFDVIEVNTSPGPRLSQCSGTGNLSKAKKYL